MMTANERRLEILNSLSVRRQDTISNLAAEFQVSNRTIERDIVQLSCSAPIYTVQGNGGGIRVADGWYANKTYLNAQQEGLLVSLMSGLQPEQQKIMESILASFAKPKIPQEQS